MLHCPLARARTHPWRCISGPHPRISTMSQVYSGASTSPPLASHAPTAPPPGRIRGPAPWRTSAGRAGRRATCSRNLYGALPWIMRRAWPSARLPVRRPVQVRLRPGWWTRPRRRAVGPGSARPLAQAGGQGTWWTTALTAASTDGAIPPPADARCTPEGVRAAAVALNTRLPKRRFGPPFHPGVRGPRATGPTQSRHPGCVGATPAIHHPDAEPRRSAYAISTASPKSACHDTMTKLGQPGSRQLGWHALASLATHSEPPYAQAGNSSPSPTSPATHHRACRRPDRPGHARLRLRPRTRTPWAMSSDAAKVGYTTPAKTRGTLKTQNPAHGQPLRHRAQRWRLDSWAFRAAGGGAPIAPTRAALAPCAGDRGFCRRRPALSATFLPERLTGHFQRRLESRLMPRACAWQTRPAPATLDASCIAQATRPGRLPGLCGSAHRTGPVLCAPPAPWAWSAPSTPAPATSARWRAPPPCRYHP